MISEEKYLFTLIQEECAEISQVASKIVRFGLLETRPGGELNNLERIKEEIVDLLGVVSFIEQKLGVQLINNVPFIDDKILKKIDKIKKYMEYSRNRGELQ